MMSAHGRMHEAGPGRLPSDRTTDGDPVNAPSERSKGAPRRRPAEVRKLLLEAAERVVMKKGTSANALEIAREAGVHRSVLYRHFTSAEELVQIATLRPFSEFLLMFQAMADSELPGGPMPLWDLMYGFLDDLIENLAKHREFLIMVLSEMSPLDGDDREESQRTLDSVLDQVALLSESEGKVRGVDVTSIGLNTRLVIAMAAGVVSFGDWLLPHGEHATERQQLIEQMSNLVLYGVRNVPGAEKAKDRVSPKGRRG